MSAWASRMDASGCTLTTSDVIMSFTVGFEISMNRRRTPTKNAPAVPERFPYSLWITAGKNILGILCRFFFPRGAPVSPWPHLTPSIHLPLVLGNGPCGQLKAISIYRRGILTSPVPCGYLPIQRASRTDRQVRQCSFPHDRNDPRLDSSFSKLILFFPKG
mgnify:CR=1 FL=1